MGRCVGLDVGDELGRADGLPVVGRLVGLCMGDLDGAWVEGLFDGNAVGNVGEPEGRCVGLPVVGLLVGRFVGDFVGA